MFTVFRSVADDDKTLHGHGSAKMSAVMMKIFNPNTDISNFDQRKKLQNEFFDAIPRINADLYVKSAVFDIFTLLTTSI